MAETSNIAWTKSTFNPWIGCTKIGPGCDHCYAEAQDSRKRWGGVTHWGAGVPRHRTSGTYWQHPKAWNNKQIDLRRQGDAPPWNVFCASLADVFDNDVPQQWRGDLWTLIADTPALSWLLVTKRIGNVPSMVPLSWINSPRGFPPNVRLMITVVNQEEADRDIPKMLALNCKNGVSYEPALCAVDWAAWLYPDRMRMRGDSGPVHVTGQPCINWIIVGGESTQGGHQARQFNIEWARSTIAQCKAAGVPAFMKQAGSFVIDRNDAGFEGDGDDVWPAGTADKLVWEPFGYVDNAQGSAVRIKLRDRAGADPDEWPEDLRVREFP